MISKPPVCFAVDLIAVVAFCGEQVVYTASWVAAFPIILATENSGLHSSSATLSEMEQIQQNEPPISFGQIPPITRAPSNTPRVLTSVLAIPVLTASRRTSLSFLSLSRMYRLVTRYSARSVRTARRGLRRFTRTAVTNRLRKCRRVGFVLLIAAACFLLRSLTQRVRCLYPPFDA